MEAMARDLINHGLVYNIGYAPCFECDQRCREEVCDEGQGGRHIREPTTSVHQVYPRQRAYVRPPSPDYTKN